MAERKFTISGIASLKAGETAWDARTRGLGCRCQGEKKSYILKYRFHGRQRLYTMGVFGDDFTPEQAREEAARLWEMIRSGNDPAVHKKNSRDLPLFRQGFEKFLEEVKSKRKSRTHAEYERIYEKLIKSELGHLQIDSIARADIAKLHNKLVKTPYQANRVLALLSSFFSWCLKNGYRKEILGNPCQRIDKYKEKAREKFLSEESVYNLGQALCWYEEQNRIFRQPARRKDTEQKENNVTLYAVAAIRLLILTGARLNEILTLKWDEVDLKNKQIRLGDSKTGAKSIYLSAPARKVLSEIPKIEENPYVICGRFGDSHLVNLTKPWKIIRKRAGMPDLRLHDLRHNFASTAVVTGHHLKIVGALLGHADTQTTERYAHLANDPLQNASESISQRILTAMTTKPSKDNVVSIAKAR
ncbi:MAG: DUF4102 domain-containing protein [Verrucomicrobiae bacterium]|nr:DUF4102 domain-containing protein [Verrucomicrobiae bacterium]